MKVLLISYYYPPMGGAGVQRALKLSKYLGDFGVEPVVLAGHDPGYTRDESLLAEVPAGVRVLRIEHRSLMQRLLARRAATVAPRSAAAPAAASRSPWLRDTLLGAYAATRFPDEQAGWAKRAFEPALALLRDERIELIFSTAPPMSAHALAARLARRSGLPWVADYRDLWTDNPGYLAPGWRRAIDQRTEAAWLKRAAGVVTVTPSWQRQFAQRLGAALPVVFVHTERLRRGRFRTATDRTAQRRRVPAGAHGQLLRSARPRHAARWRGCVSAFGGAIGATAGAAAGGPDGVALCRASGALRCRAPRRRRASPVRAASRSDRRNAVR